MRVVKTSCELRQQIDSWKQGGHQVGFVPTMGALHEGHLALIRCAHDLADRIVTSVFVNPTQFGPSEDFDRYPRDTSRDAQLLAAAGCHLLFLPDVATVYPNGQGTFVDVEGVSEGLEGRERPGHFRGVATVVVKLFSLVQPDVAVFGEKDAQQLAVVRQLVRDLHLPVKIEAHATVRETDGLALSSRNAYLRGEDRQAATILFRALCTARDAIETGERSAATITKIMYSVLESEPRLRIDYAAVVDAETFQPLDPLSGRIVLPVAGSIAGTRLLDNIRIDLND